MDILLGIAGKLVEYSVARQVGYLAHYNSNHQILQTKFQDLGAAREEVQHKVDQFEREGKKIEKTVLNWRTRVDEIVKRTEEFLKGGHHAQTNCLHGFCPHPVLRYKLGKKSAKLAEEIVELHGQKDFSTFIYDVPLQDLSLLSRGNYHEFASRNLIVKKVMDELRNPDTEMILVWGIGGVGKTTLVEEVLKQAKEVKLFEDVVMVRDVKENPDLAKIQRDISTDLGMSINENDTPKQRASKLYDRIKDKRVLVALDDVWEELNLVTIGLPRLANCKIVLTSRNRQRLSSDDRKQEDISIDVMDENEAWSLFEKMAGDVVKDKAIQTVAKQVAEKCGRLPLLIVTVARALKGKDKMSAWRDTLRRLGSFDKKGLKEKAYVGVVLEWSYEQLEETELKPLFMLCGILVVQNHIYLGDLLKYGFGLGLIKNVVTIEEARDAFDTLVEKLKDSCLLLDGDKNMHVRMHDLVCEVAVMIASRDQQVLSVEYGGELKEWPDKDFFRRCSKMSLKSGNIPMLSQVPIEECQNLEMIHLQCVASEQIPSHFFCETKKLKVLGITDVSMICLPPSLECLKDLQMLSLKSCWRLEDVILVGHLTNLEILSFAGSNIKLLPKEIGQLIGLRWLDLSDCGQLKVISPNIFLRLEKLEELTMRNVSLEWNGKRGSENIATLKELTELSRLTALEIYIEDAKVLPQYFFSSKLVKYQIWIGYVWNPTNHSDKVMHDTVVNTLKLELFNLGNQFEADKGVKGLLQRSEDLSLEGSETFDGMLTQLRAEDFQQLLHLRLQNNVDFSYIIEMKVVFPNLTTLSVNKLNHLRFLFTVSMAKSLVELKHLEVTKYDNMEEIVSTKDEANDENIDIVFSKLESLELTYLPYLTRMICTESSTVSPLETINTKLVCGSGTDVPPSLFDSKIKFPSLERLKILMLGKLQTLWNNKELAGQDSFDKLKEVDVGYCENLITMFVPRMLRRLNALETLDIRTCNSVQVVFEEGIIEVEDHPLKPVYCQNLVKVHIRECDSLRYFFPASVARGLQKLRDMDMMHCKKVEEMIGGEKGLETEPHPIFEFPKVTSLKLFNLPKLCRFYPGLHVSRWPSLHHLDLNLSSEMKIISAEKEPIPMIGQSFLLVEKDSFPSLESIVMDFSEIWYGPSLSPTEVFSKLNSVEFLHSKMTPFLKQAMIDFLQKLHKLAELKFSSNQFIEILFVSQETNNGEEIHHPVRLSGVKTLKIWYMSKLLQLGNGKSHTVGPLLPCLDTLDVRYCDLLKSPVESSAISFRFLTTLIVFGCPRLEYLTSYSVA